MRTVHVPPSVEGEAKSRGWYVACLALHAVSWVVCGQRSLLLSIQILFFHAPEVQGLDEGSGHQDITGSLVGM